MIPRVFNFAIFMSKTRPLRLILGREKGIARERIDITGWSNTLED